MNEKLLSPNDYAQLPIIELNMPAAATMNRKKKVEETFSKIRQLHEELNQQLYAKPSERPMVGSPEQAASILNYFIGSLDHEELWVMNLDTRNRVMSLVALYKGSVNASQVRIAEVFRQAIIDNCPNIVVAHNHPSGDTSPSPEDVAVTRCLCQAGKLLDISVLDHVIVAGGRHTSLKERGLGFS